jgi:hypothetical protein
MGHAQLSAAAGAQSTDCPSLPKVGFTDSHAASTPVGADAPINGPQSNLNALRPEGSSGKGASSTYEALDLDPPQTPVNPENSNAKAIKSDNSAGQTTSTAHDAPPQPELPVNTPKSNANALKPDSTSGNAVQSTYENLDLDIRDYPQQTPPADENQQGTLMNRIKNISAAKSAAPASAAAPAAPQD